MMERQCRHQGAGNNQQTGGDRRKFMFHLWFSGEVAVDADRQQDRQMHQIKAEGDASQEEWSGSAALLWRDLIRGDPTLTPLNLEFRLYALRNPPFRKRLVEVQRQYVSRIADFIDRISNTLGLRLKISAADLAEITNAATLGLTELASVDVEQAERYDRLVEQFFRLMMEATIEATPASSSSKKRRG